MLDTNIVSDVIRNPRGRAASRTVEAGADIYVSIIVAGELRYGCAKKGSPQLVRRVEAVLAALNVVPYDEPADRVYGLLRAELEANGRVIGGNDLLIAAHALATDATLVTANVGEFSRIETLRVENWLL